MSTSSPFWAHDNDTLFNRNLTLGMGSVVCVGSMSNVLPYYIANIWDLIFLSCVDISFALDTTSQSSQ
jgi:hypothetical protein